jgi:hypothetical protein
MSDVTVDLTGRRVKVTDPRKVRALTYLPHGQRYEGWLPCGLWEHLGACNVNEPDGRGGWTHTPAAMLRKVGAGESGTWYVGQPAEGELFGLHHDLGGEG